MGYACPLPHLSALQPLRGPPEDGNLRDDFHHVHILLSTDPDPLSIPVMEEGRKVTYVTLITITSGMRTLRLR